MKRLALALCLGAGAAVATLHVAMPAPLKAQRTRPAAAPTLCRAGEQALFQCRVGRRHVALCAGESSAGGRFVQYRYGRPGRVELAFPDRGASGLSWARTGYSGGGELQVNAEREGHRYVLYSRVIRTRFDGQGNAPRFSAGLAVIRGNRILSDRECSDTDEGWSEEAAVERWLPEGPFTAWWDLEEQSRR